MGIKLKVLMISWHTNSGIVHYTSNLCQALTNEGVDVVLLTSSKNKEIDKFKANFKIIKYIMLIERPSSIFEKFTFVPMRLVAYLYNSALILFIGKSFKIIHFQWYIFPRLDRYLFYIINFFGKRLVYTVHNLLPHEENKNDRKVLRKLYRASDILIVHDEFTRKSLISDFGVRRDKLRRTIHGNYNSFLNFAPNNENLKRLKSRFGIYDKEEKVVLFFGSISDYKGLDILIKAFEIVRGKLKAKLLIAGGTKDFSTYEKLIGESVYEQDIITRIRYIPIHEVYKFFSVADVVVVPYRKTYYSGSIILAFSFAKPVIATLTGGIPEMIEEGKSGWLVPAENINVLAEKIVEALQNKDRLLSMGRYAFEVASKRLSWEKAAQITRRIYESLYLHPSA